MPKAKQAQIVHENSFDVLPVEQLEPDEPDVIQTPGANANVRHNRSTSVQSTSSLSPIQRIESSVQEAIALIDADKHTIEWWASGLSVRLRALLAPARHLATELAQSSTPHSAAVYTSTTQPSSRNNPSSPDQSPVPIGQPLSVTDIEAAVARALPAILQKELAHALRDLHDTGTTTTRPSDSSGSSARSCADASCSTHASHNSNTVHPPLPALPQATERDITVSLASVAPDHAVRSLSEAELKAVVDASLARSLPPGSSKPALLGVKKLANGNLRLRALSEDVKDALVKEPGTWLPALAENAQLARDLYTVEVRAVPLAFRPSEAHAIQGLCQANAHVFPDASHVVTMRWLRDPRETHDKRTSSLLVVVDGNQAFCKAIYHGIAIHGRLCDVSPYVPSPTQCYFCQGWNHTVTACPRKKKNLTIICARCAGPHATSACSCPHSPACSSRRTCTHIAVKCANCGGRHKSFSVDCPTRRRAADEVARSPKYARALSAYMSSLDRPWDAVASDARHSLPFSSSPRAGSAWRD